MTYTSTSESFGKKERLKSRAIIQQLFQTGSSLFVFPLKLIYTHVDYESIDAYEFKVGVTVPKRNHKKAWQRNLLKRRIREAYRQNKPVIEERRDKSKRYALMYILVDQNITEYHQIEKAMIKLNAKLINKISKVHD